MSCQLSRRASTVEEASCRVCHDRVVGYLPSECYCPHIAIPRLYPQCHKCKPLRFAQPRPKPWGEAVSPPPMYLSYSKKTSHPEMFWMLPLAHCLPNHIDQNWVRGSYGSCISIEGALVFSVTSNMKLITLKHDNFKQQFFNSINSETRWYFCLRGYLLEFSTQASLGIARHLNCIPMVGTCGWLELRHSVVASR